MAITLVHPEGLPEVDAYHHVSVATGSKTVFVAGQVAWDADGNTVGEGDLAAQVERCLLNVAAALAATGAAFGDLAKLTIYVVDWAPEKMPVLMEGVSRAYAELGVAPSPPATLIGVAALDVPDHLVEVEATAVLD
jgi:enamine deaminase RidA (YjgF/YER057c/UK114 family)